MEDPQHSLPARSETHDPLRQVSAQMDQGSREEYKLKKLQYEHEARLQSRRHKLKLKARAIKLRYQNSAAGAAIISSILIFALCWLFLFYNQPEYIEKC